MTKACLIGFIQKAFEETENRIFFPNFFSLFFSSFWLLLSFDLSLSFRGLFHMRSSHCTVILFSGRRLKGPYENQVIEFLETWIGTLDYLFVLSFPLSPQQSFLRRLMTDIKLLVINVLEYYWLHKRDGDVSRFSNHCCHRFEKSHQKKPAEKVIYYTSSFAKKKSRSTLTTN